MKISTIKDGAMKISAMIDSAMKDSATKDGAMKDMAERTGNDAACADESVSRPPKCNRNWFRLERKKESITKIDAISEALEKRF